MPIFGISTMRTNKPMFGPVVLEIACDIFASKTSSWKYMYVCLSVKSFMCYESIGTTHTVIHLISALYNKVF